MAGAATGPGSNGVGSVFASNPVQGLGLEGLTDRKDTDSAVPTAAYHDVQLTNLDGSGYLCGTYACVRSSTGSLAFSADEHVSVHAPSGSVRAGDRVLLDHRGSGIRPAASASARPCAASTTCGGRYVSIVGRGHLVHLRPSDERDSRIGKGGVDDAEDAEVILRGYGHAVRQGQNLSFSCEQAGAISEGFADYWAVTVTDVVAKRIGWTEREPLPYVANSNSTSYTSTVPTSVCVASTSICATERLDRRGAPGRRDLVHGSGTFGQAVGDVKADALVLEGSMDFPDTTMPDLAHEQWLRHSGSTDRASRRRFATHFAARGILSDDRQALPLR